MAMPGRIETGHSQPLGGREEALAVPRTESAATGTATTAMTRGNALAHDLDPPPGTIPLLYTGGAYAWFNPPDHAPARWHPTQGRLPAGHRDGPERRDRLLRGP